ncbi:MAG: DUF1501 domain-containing protein [Planctomycetaceae bacterium]|nr:DUF1501 domain-containing protein [Planctomycetaceae bacterium]
MRTNETRRSLLRSAALTTAVATPAGRSLIAGVTFGQEAAVTVASPELPRKGKAKSCIFIWLGGGAAQIDTWDPKVVGDPKQGSKKPGSAYPSIPTAISGVSVCEHLPKMAARLDRGCVIRSVHHEVIDEHAAAVNRMHVGRAPTGTTVYPSIGSVVSHELGSPDSEVPAYIVMGYPSATRGPGFLGAKHNYIYLIDTESGPAGLQRPADVTADRLARRQKLLGHMRDDYRRKYSGFRVVEDYVDAGLQGDKLAGPTFASVFNLQSEDPNLRNAYGSEFGQRCLLARRLVESGVRFVEVAFNLNFINGTGWDTHNDGQLNQHVLIQELDKSLAALVDDLEQRGLLDSTLIAIGTEFGRPPEFDGGGGRGHQGAAFSVPLFGGGLKSGLVIGETDEFSRKVVSRPVSVPDLHATIYTALGIDPAKELYDGNRPVPITDHGKPVAELFQA